MTLIRSRPHGKGILGRNKTGPVLYLGDTQKSASQWSDISGRGNHGLVYGAGTPPAATPGALGYLFDGVDDYVDAGNAASLNITGDLTVAVWIKPNVNGSYTSFVADNGNDNTRAFCLEYNVLTPRFVLGTGTSYVARGGPAISLGNYSHIVGTVSNTTMMVYVNGVASSPNTFAGSRQNINSIRVGARPAQPNYFNGSIDEVRIYNRALSAAEIKRYFERTRILFGV